MTTPLQFGPGQCKECGATVISLLYVFHGFRWFMQLESMAMTVDKSPEPLAPREQWREHLHPMQHPTGVMHELTQATMPVPALEDTNS